MAVGRLGAAVLVVAAVVVALPLATAGASGPISAVPEQVYDGWPWQPAVRDHPAGPAAVLLSGKGRGIGGVFENSRGSVTVLSRSGVYRIQRYAARVTAGRSVLLSPDGRWLAATVPDRGAGRPIATVTPAAGTPAAPAPAAGRAVWLTDLTTGRTTAYPAGSGSLTVLAWGAALALADRNRVLTFDPRTGRFTTVAALPAVSAAAWSPDGRRLAVQSGSSLRVLGGSFSVRLPAGTLLAGPGAWSRDGIGVLTRSGCAVGCSQGEQDRRQWRLGHVVGAAVVPAGLPAVTGATVRVLGPMPGGAVAVTVDPARAGPTRVLRLRRGRAPAQLIETPYATVGVDVSAALLSAGRSGGSSPRPALWPMAGWVTVPAIVLGAGLIALLLALFRRRR